MLEKVAAFADAVLDALFPPKCIVCGEIGAVCCDKCEGKLPVIDREGACPVCGSPLSSAGSCADCFPADTMLTRCIAFGVYDGALRDAIIDFKFNNKPEFGRKLMIHMLGHMDHSFADQFDICVPVPLHVTRERERGYNQAEILARGIARAHGKPCSARNLRRIRKTVTQIGLSHDERAENLRGSFALSDPAEISGKRILLVDDVCTTGSTLFECAATLKKAGAADVSGFVVARAVRD